MAEAAAEAVGPGPPEQGGCCCGGGCWRAELRSLFEEVLDRKLVEAGLSQEAQAQKELRLQAQLQQALRAWTRDSFEPGAESFLPPWKGSGSTDVPSATSSERSLSNELPGCEKEPPEASREAEGRRGRLLCARSRGYLCPVAPDIAIHPAEESVGMPGQVQAWTAEEKLAAEAAMCRDTTNSSCALSAIVKTTRKSRNRFTSGSLDSAACTRLESADGSNRCYVRVARVVTSPYFDWSVCALIVLNAISIGIQTDYVASSRTMVVPVGFRVVEGLFCCLFTLELSCRIFVHRSRFFTRAGCAWNVFDCVVVGLQVLEEVLSIVSDYSVFRISGDGGGSEVLPSNMSFARVLRILRLIRVVRLVRILRLIRELRTLVSSISNSLKSLGWTVLLLLLMIYTVSLYITQLVTDHLIASSNDSGTESPLAEDLRRYYGSLASSILSLFQSVTGGIDWDTLTYPLIKEISPWLAVLFSLYIAFAVLAMLNVVTGVFVESVLLSAKADKDIYLMNSAREIFKTVDGGVNCGAMSWDDFQEKLATPQMQDFFKHIEVDPTEAKGLFRLLDVDGSGSINADEFLNGCIRLRGPAKALDTAVLIEEVKYIRHCVREWAKIYRAEGSMSLFAASYELRAQRAAAAAAPVRGPPSP